MKSNDSTIRIGVLGTGNMGTNHVRILSAERQYFDLVGIFDPDSERTERLEKRYGVRVFPSQDALFQSVEAVVIAIPSSRHLGAGMQAAQNNIHALIEKPLALTGTDGQMLTDAFKKKAVLMVGHVERFNPVVIELKKILGQNTRMVSVEIHRYSPFTPQISDVSVVEDLMIHDIDLACYLVGGQVKRNRIHRVKSAVKSGRTDFAVCLLEFSSGVSAVISASRISQEKERKIRIHTEDSFIEADLLNRTLTVTRGTRVTFNDESDLLYTQDSIAQRIFVPSTEPLREELLSFYRAIREGVAVAVDGKTATEAIRICEEVLK